MLTKIELQNFKCFKEMTAFPLGKLTLLTGINGRGKSTLLQSLILMRQSIEYNEQTTQLILNGNCLKLGTFDEIRNTAISIQEPIIFKFHYDNQLDFDKDLKLQKGKYYIDQCPKTQVKEVLNYSFIKDLHDDMIAQISEIEYQKEITCTFIDQRKEYPFLFEMNRSYKDFNNSMIPNLLARLSQDNHGTQKELLEKADNSKNVSNIVYKPSEEITDYINHATLWKMIPFSNDDNWMKEIKIHISKFKDFEREIKPSSDDENYWFPNQLMELELFIQWNQISLSFLTIHYISADRLAPQDFYFKSILPKFSNVGAKGELTANLLYRKKDELVNDRLCLGEDAKTLITQTQEWLNKIFDGAKIEVLGTETNVLELMFNTSLSKDRFRPANIGFGYHCILPIIVSGLIAKEGEILIVENPEAHLHPKAQSELAKFLAKVSSCGVQVFIESHSDHILNGLRIAVLDNILNNEDLSILYFSQKIGQSVVQIPVSSDGSIEEWPEGFFDQMDKDFERLFGI